MAYYNVYLFTYSPILPEKNGNFESRDKIVPNLYVI